ncbi:MAG: AMP-binding protein [Proteobacteria bacterium]|nr:AMP-binding protein [Pseudomonadota bacterium]
MIDRNLALALVQAAMAAPELPALGHGARMVATYAQLARRAGSLAAALRQRLRLVPGDRVAIAARNTPEFIEILYGIWHAGLAAVPVNAKLHAAELGYILDHCGARAAFVGRDIAAALGAHAPAGLERAIVIGGDEYAALMTADPAPIIARARDDLAWLFYTSGTTGRPKGAQLTHGVLDVMSRAYLAEVDPVAPGDGLLHGAPMSHGSGLYIMAHVANRGVNIVPESGGFDAPEIFALLRGWPRSSLFAAPTMVNRLIECAADFPLDHLRTIVWGGAPMYVEDARRALDRFGARLAQIYGQGESPMTITRLTRAEIADREHPRWIDRLASAGRAFGAVDVMVADADDRALPADAAGEILCRGGAVMPGYWRDPQASAATLRGGWLHTGDIGALDAEGYLTLKDRSKDVIISGGSNIYPREVEEVLLRHQAVREVSVIGRPDRQWGEVVVAYVVGEAPASELDALCLDAIARFKRPKEYLFVDALPKNNYGKVLKTQLRARDASRAQTPQSMPPARGPT